MCRGHTYFKKEYNMSRFSFCFIKQGATPPITPSESDLVALKILPKQVSEFTSDDIGTPVLIPYTDPTGKILLNDGNIEFEVVGVNHHTSSEHLQTITLMTKNIIRHAALMQMNQRIQILIVNILEIIVGLNQTFVSG